MSDTGTPAGVLRRAAALMRERAAAAPEGPWGVKAGHLGGHPHYVTDAAGFTIAECWGEDQEEAAAVHAASWGPLAALAVAEWLDAAVASAAYTEASGAWIHPDSYALKVARAYLDETPVPAAGGRDISDKETSDEH